MEDNFAFVFPLQKVDLSSFTVILPNTLLAQTKIIGLDAKAYFKKPNTDNPSEWPCSVLMGIFGLSLDLRCRLNEGESPTKTDKKGDKEQVCTHHSRCRPGPHDQASKGHTRTSLACSHTAHWDKCRDSNTHLCLEWVRGSFTHQCLHLPQIFTHMHTERRCKHITGTHA